MSSEINIEVKIDFKGRAAQDLLFRPSETRIPCEHGYSGLIPTAHVALLTRFRRASDGELIRGPKRGFFLVHFHFLPWLFFS